VTEPTPTIGRRIELEWDSSEVVEAGPPWSRNWSPTPPNSAELLGRDSLYQARFGSIDGFRRDS
jgi:hypothetical protein